MQDEVLVGIQRPVDSDKKKQVDEMHNVEDNKLYVPQITDTEDVTDLQTQIQNENLVKNGADKELRPTSS